MAVTESSGNGYALYNGVKLPNIESVWTDELKAEYPYAVICYVDYAETLGIDIKGHILFCFDQPLTYDTDSLWWQGETSGAVLKYCTSSVFPTQADIDALAALGVPTDGVTPGVWTSIRIDEYNSETDGIRFVGTPVWSNYDVLNEDGTLYLAASDPIPLDGMTVIEWDGDTEGLVNRGETYYRIADYFNPTSILGVFDLPSDTIIKSDLIKTDRGWEMSDGDMITGILYPAMGISEAYASENDDVSGVYAIECPSLLAYIPDEDVPVENKNFDLRSWLIGYTLGICGKPISITKEAATDG